MILFALPLDVRSQTPPEAANEQVAEVIRQFSGRGALSDGSTPTPASDAIKNFKLASGLSIELVAAEPTVEQPLFINFDHRGRMWVVQYRQYPFPAGLKVVRYDQHLRAVFDRVPQAPPNHIVGRDIISVFEDTDGDGTYDTSRDVITGLNISTSVVADTDAIWVLNPPYLLRYPDADGDAVPDGDPVVHLSGFGLEDTHSVANSLCWGPDGWLYAANGSTTTGKVRTRDGREQSFEGQCIWRYHPKFSMFEIYAEGGGNTFSLEIDSVGRVFSGTNHGNTRGMYYPQGSYGEKNWGKHGPLTNPYAFGFFKHMTSTGDRNRFAQTFAIYEASALPDLYRGNIIAANSLHNRVWASRLLADTSTFRTEDMPPVVETSDRWFRPVDVKVGPDGAVYLADWYDSRLSHVDPRDDWHKTSGRIYRIVASDNSAEARDAREVSLVPTPTKFDLAQATDETLLELLSHPNKFFRQTAVRMLGKRTNDALADRLKEIAKNPADPRSLEALWAVHLMDKLDPALTCQLLQHPNEHVRGWTVRLLGDRRQVTGLEASALLRLATAESIISVRSQLACSARRLAAPIAMEIVERLVCFDDDLNDLHQPLLLWWAVESHCEQDADIVLKMLETNETWERPLVRGILLERLMKRFALSGTEKDWQICEQLLELAPTPADQKPLVQGFREALAGRIVDELPDSLMARLAKYQQDRRESDLPLRLRAGDPAAVTESLKQVVSSTIDLPTRIELAAILGEVHPPGADAVLQKVLSGTTSPPLQKISMLALSAYDAPTIGSTICRLLHSSLTDEQGVRHTAFKVLASRSAWTDQLLTEVEEWRVKRESIPMDVVQQMTQHQDKDIPKRIHQIWGSIRATKTELNEELEKVRQIVSQGRGDAKSGRALFAQRCEVCHKLFESGGQTGPELNGYERDNLQFLLPAIVDPSLAIREEFTSYRVLTQDGRVLTGLLEDQTPRQIVLRGADNKTILIPRDQIESLQAQSTSLMPEGLLRDLDDKQIRDLIAYVTSRAPLAE